MLMDANERRDAGIAAPNLLKLKTGAERVRNPTKRDEDRATRDSILTI
jgi:hypothetical protein